MRKPRLLFVIDSLGCGGAEKSLVSLLGLLDYNRVDVDLLVLVPGGMFESLVPEQVNRINHQLLRPGLLTRLRQLRYSAWLRLPHKRHTAEMRWICTKNSVLPLEKQYDVAIAYQQGFPTFFVASQVRAERKLAWINSDIFETGYYDIAWNSKFYNTFDYIVPVSERLSDKLKRACPQWNQKYTTIYDIINPNLIRQMAAEMIIEDTQMKQQTAIMTVGRLHSLKNHFLAVDTAHVLRERGLNFRWWFIGEGSLHKAIEAKIAEYDLQDRVILLGHRENPYPYIARADVYVQTSSLEGFGLTIAEAKILGRPIVSTNFDVVYDQISDGENGLIVEMKPEAVAEAIERVISDSDLRSRLARSAASEQNTTAITEVDKLYRLIGLN